MMERAMTNLLIATLMIALVALTNAAEAHGDGAKHCHAHGTHTMHCH
jgi:hypothetical protein